MPKFRKLIRFIIAGGILLPYWYACSIVNAFINWLNDDDYLYKVISRKHLNWLRWRD